MMVRSGVEASPKQSKPSSKAAGATQTGSWRAVPQAGALLWVDQTHPFGGSSLHLKKVAAATGCTFAWHLGAIGLAKGENTLA